jgi:hypothetical protein
MDDNQEKTCICTSRWLDNIVLSEQGGWSPTYGHDMPWRNGKNWVPKTRRFSGAKWWVRHTPFFRTRKWKMLVSARDSQTASWTSDPPYGLFSARAILSRIFLGFYGTLRSLLIFLIVPKSFLFSWNSYSTTLPRKSQWPDLPWVNCGLSLHITTKWVNPRKWIISHCPIAGRVENPGTSNGYSPPLIPHIYGTRWHYIGS